MPSIEFSLFIKHFKGKRKNSSSDARTRLLEVFAGRFRLKRQDKAIRGKIQGEIGAIELSALSWSSQDESVFCVIRFWDKHIRFVLPTRHGLGNMSSYCAVGQDAGTNDENGAGGFVNWSARIVGICKSEW